MSNLPNDVKTAVLIVVIAALIAACFEPLVTFWLCLFTVTTWAVVRLFIYLMEGL